VTIVNRLIAPLLLLAVALVVGAAAAAERPNIVLVIADDQGYGDLGHTGNPVIQTPHLDALAAESTSLTDYHVAPTCSPTRAALLTGHWTDRTGVWHTINGRSMLRENEVTLGQLLRDNGYATGMFGKWHLGDNFPYRPEDRGFAEVYRHGGGGVGQTPDCWDNAYFDGHYFHNGEVVPAEGFCTDVFFREAHRFIRQEAEAGRPFFAYISTNAPHGPLHCPQEYLDRYAGQPAALAAFFGMITNIDDNIGATRKLLAELGIAENTLFIFTTDNGTATGAKVFNAGMRGQKGSEYDGGHRVPFIAHWPAAGWNRQHACDRLCHAVDVVPTLVELAGGKRPDGLAWDGVSIRTLLDPAADTDVWPDRMLVTDSQRVRDPIKWKQTAVMSQRWRLVNGKELYDIEADPGQRNNLAADHPEQVAAMTAFYDAWWAELQPTFAHTTEIYLGHPEAAEVTLTCHDWIGTGACPWNQGGVRAAEGYRRAAPEKQGKQRPDKQRPDTKQPAAGPAARHDAHWAVKVVTAGDYTVAVRRWPAEVNRAIVAGLPPGQPVPGASRAFRETAGVALPVVSACLRIDGRDLDTVAVEQDATVVRFTVPLEAGSHELAPVFRTADGHEVGGYYCTVSGPLRPPLVSPAQDSRQP
jgi:arylsulfatase A-like enzyme